MRQGLRETAAGDDTVKNIPVTPSPLPSPRSTHTHARTQNTYSVTVFTPIDP